MKNQGECTCGKVKVGILTESLMSYNCHCSNCRAFASKFRKEPQPFQAAVFVWRWSVKTEGAIEYEQSVALGGLFAMQRGRCASCKDPIWEQGQRLAAPYAMVMAKPLGIIPDTNLYYDSGYKKGPTDMKVTIYSDLGSLVYEIWIVLSVAIWHLPQSVFASLGTKEFKKV
jgi:hypothetical protein